MSLCSRQLKKAGCGTTLANNGVEALEAIETLYKDSEQQFDIILMGKSVRTSPRCSHAHEFH